MSVQILEQPSLFQPVYNDVYSRSLSTNIHQTNFKYLFDLFCNSGGTNLYIGRFPLNLRYGTNDCLFSPNRILESYFSYDLTHNLTACTFSTGCCRQYTVFIGEQFGNPPANFTGFTQYSGFTFGGVASYQLLPDYRYNNYWTNYYMTGSNSSFLTTQPSSVKIRDNERASISFLNYNNFSNQSFSASPYFVKVTTHQTTGGTIDTYIINSVNLTGKTANPDYLINHFGCGIWNLNNIATSSIASGSTPIFNPQTDYKYDVRLVNNDLSEVSKNQTFLLDTSCTKYTPIRFMFLNSLGAFDYFTCTLMSRSFLSSKRTNYRKNLTYNYTVGDAGLTVQDIDSQVTMSVTTDWVSNQESEWLQDLWNSKQVYHLLDDGTILPVVLQTESIEIKKMVNDKLFNYTFEVEYAFKKNTQRG